MAQLGSANTNLRPQWAKRSYYQIDANDSFLVDLEAASTTRSDFIDELVDTRTAKEISQRYDDLVRNYELRRTYGLVDQREEQDHAERVGGFGRSFLTEVRMSKIKKDLKSLENNAMRDSRVRAAARPIAVAGALTAAATGTPVEFSLGTDTRFKSTTNVVDQTGLLLFSSPVIRGSVEVAAKAPERAVEPGSTAEKYRFSLSRELPLLDLTSGVSYGTSTSGLTTSISKELATHLTCVVDSTRPVEPASTLPSHQETFRLLYGLSF